MKMYSGLLLHKKYNPFMMKQKGNGLIYYVRVATKLTTTELQPKRHTEHMPSADISMGSFSVHKLLVTVNTQTSSTQEVPIFHSNVESQLAVSPKIALFPPTDPSDKKR